MSTALTALKYPIAIRPEHVRDSTTTIKVTKRGSGWLGGTFTIKTTPSGTKGEPKVEKLFSVDCKAASIGQRRQFYDASGLPLFELSRHNKVGMTWFLYLPGGKAEPIATLKPKFSLIKQKVDVEVANAAVGREVVTLEVRGEDILGPLRRLFTTVAR